MPNRFTLRSASIFAFILFRFQLYAAQKVENLKFLLNRDRFSSFALHRCDTLFIFLAFFFFFLALSRAFSIVSRGVSRDIIPTGALTLFPPPPLLSSASSHPPSLSTYKRFDWNRSASRQARKEASKQARHFKWRFLPLFLFPPLELLLASLCLPPSFSLSFAPLRHYRSYLHRHCIVQATSTCNFLRFLISLHDDVTKKNRGIINNLRKIL